jgi:Fe2+ or Zn2+ uptake regulation protein
MNIFLEPDYTFDEYLNHFFAFLGKHNLRKTNERNVILHTIYNCKKHFTVDILQKKLEYKRYHVSQTTLYKTLALLIDADLVSKYHFPAQSTPQYEKTYRIHTHNHLYREDTSEIIEFSDDRIADIISSIENKYNIKATSYSFTIYCTSRTEEPENKQ